MRITPTTFAAELERFREHEHVFSSKAKLNDMWLEIDLQDPTFERAVGTYLLRLLGERYTPFGRIALQEHC